jgi:predicted O-linked N-acetylglucosamine transferase (SPINDLY family)|tara:strand:+ start:219 stop:2084 length:1866 start_codon:yes stop_codon:yes gene_type:complete
MHSKFDQAINFFENGNLNESKKLCLEILKDEPKNFDILHLLGIISFQLKDYKKSSELISEAIKINPKDAETYNNMGIALKELNQFDIAHNNFCNAIKLKPDYAEAHYNCGVILKELEQEENAIKSFKLATKFKKNYAEAYHSLGNIFFERKKFNEALQNFYQSYKINPKLNYLLSSIIYTKHRICEWNSFDKDLLDLENVILNEKNKINPFLTLSFYESPQLQKTSAEIFVKNEYDVQTNQNYKFHNQTKKKIRIAYYSADFRNHPMSYLLANLYELHDKNKFEIIGISFGPDKDDEMRKRVSSAFDEFYDVRLKTEDEIVKFSRELKIDIAIDLMCFTKYHKFGIFVKRCAPIQVNYLGYPGTSGTNYLDYIIADKILIPKESQKYYSEKIAYLPDTYQANDSTKKISDKIFTREELGLPKDGFVFCCFNNNYKITPQVFDVWMRLLKRVENSVLWILSENINISKNLKKEATIRGVDFNRIVFAERIKMNEHLARQKVADLFIDTFPYTGHTTASDALWVGLPVLTRIGKSFASRVSTSLLNAIGLSALVTNSEKEYEDFAIELATNSPKLKEIKNKLKNNKNTKPLFNTQVFARNIEKAYSLMYERYLKKLPIKNIEI